MANSSPDSINHGICGHVFALNYVFFLLLISLYVVLCCVLCDWHKATIVIWWKCLE
ncbi:hypothetical protein AHAS_Ahas13G0352200 [Arachis hypogaea]